MTLNNITIDTLGAKDRRAQEKEGAIGARKIGAREAGKITKSQSSRGKYATFSDGVSWQSISRRFLSIPQRS